MKTHTSHYSLAIHGGCGMISKREDYHALLTRILTAGVEMLKHDASALDVVTHCVSLLEDDPLVNAGHGSVLNAEGEVEMDASIMDGRDLSAGAVAGVTSVRNPVQLARAILEAREHVFLLGKGAELFAQAHHIPTESPDYFITPARIAQLKEVQTQGGVALDHSESATSEKKFGTVGAVAYDTKGNLASATSTGGLVNKHFGRIGDTPVIGAGTYADNTSGAISCTGFGEHILRTSLSKEIAVYLRDEQLTAQEGAERGIAYLVECVNGMGGVIVIDRHGRCGTAHSTPNLLAGYVERSGPVVLV
jgi:L-asparaginase / beta-aspartyl-peptidase